MYGVICGGSEERFLFSCRGSILLLWICRWSDVNTFDNRIGCRRSGSACVLLVLCGAGSLYHDQLTGYAGLLSGGVLSKKETLDDSVPQLSDDE